MSVFDAPRIADFTGEIDWDELDRAGYAGVAFYIEPGKAPSKEWIAEGARRGRILLPIDEHRGVGAAQGADVGRYHANLAVGYLEDLGVPKGVRIANAEADLGDPSGPSTDPYYDAYREAMSAAGWPEIVCYGGGEVGQRAKSRGVAVAHWLTCSGGYRESKALIALIRAGKPSGVDLWQRCANEDGLVGVGSHGIDTSYVLNPNLGLWGMAAATNEELFTVAQYEDLVARLERIEENTAASRSGVVTLIDEVRRLKARALRIHAWARAVAGKVGATAKDSDAQLAALRKMGDLPPDA